VKYIKTYGKFTNVHDQLFEHWNRYKSKDGDDISQEVVDSINDILLDLRDEHDNGVSETGLRLRCWLEQRDAEEGYIDKFYYDWKDVEEFVSCHSISFSMTPKIDFSRYYSGQNFRVLLKENEVSDMVKTIKRVNDYLSTVDEKLNIYIHYEKRYRDSMKLGFQESIKDIKDIDKLLTDFSFSESDKDFLYYISMTVNKKPAVNFKKY